MLSAADRSSLSPARGTSVVLTRAAEPSAELAAVLRRRGHDVLELPCIGTLPLDDRRALDEAVARLSPADLLVVTSRTGAEAVLGPRARAIVSRAATVGHQAAAVLAARGMRVELIAATGAELAQSIALPAGAVLLARSDRALRDLPEILAARGALVHEVVAYRTVDRVSGDARRAATLLQGGASIVLASPSAVDALLGALGPDSLAVARVIATGPTTAAHVLARTGREAVIAPWDRVAEVIA